jgi:hypothetical protein
MRATVQTFNDDTQNDSKYLYLFNHYQTLSKTHQTLKESYENMRNEINYKYQQMMSEMKEEYEFKIENLRFIIKNQESKYTDLLHHHNTLKEKMEFYIDEKYERKMDE